MVEIDEGDGPTAQRRVRKIFFIDEDVAELLEERARPNELVNRVLRAALLPTSE
jgi:hypothetical protein